MNNIQIKQAQNASFNLRIINVSWKAVSLLWASLSVVFAFLLSIFIKFGLWEATSSFNS